MKTTTQTQSMIKTHTDINATLSATQHFLQILQIKSLPVAQGTDSPCLNNYTFLQNYFFYIDILFNCSFLLNSILIFILYTFFFLFIFTYLCNCWPEFSSGD